jgi:hypothetical protein
VRRLGSDRLAVREAPLLHRAGDLLEILALEVAEERDALEEIGGSPGHVARFYVRRFAP